VNCPVCNVPLIAVEREQIEIDYCISCRGLWFDHGELEILGEKMKLKIDPATLVDAATTTSERPRQCPRCAKMMRKQQFNSKGRVIVDRCPDNQGIWFDASELGSMLDEFASVQGWTGPVVTFLGEMFGKRN
jgi:Zn-finger nucleic acid-binding protein